MHKYNDYFNILVTLAKIQFTHDDEPTISCINQDKNIDNEVYYVYIKFPNLLDYDARHDYMRMITDKNSVLNSVMQTQNSILSMLFEMHRAQLMC
jgi:hypothetical protein